WMLASLSAAAASARSRRAPAASFAGADAALSSAAPGPAVQTVNVHLAPCGAGGSPAGAAPSAGPATRDAGAQTGPEEPAPRPPLAAPPRAPRAARAECPAAPDLAGAHCGARRAWGAIARRIGGHRSFRGDRLRRCASEDEALAGYLAEEGNAIDTGEEEDEDLNAWVACATTQSESAAALLPTPAAGG
ncbi:unnamed protein product, partial [Prorocentrum cordatum]